MSGPRPFKPVGQAGDLPFSPAVVVDGWVIVSGQASVDASGAIVRDGFEGELRRSMENLERVLAAAGCGLPDVVQVRAYIGRGEDLPEFNRLYREFFRPPFPARTTLTGCLASLRFEIDAVARAPG